VVRRISHLTRTTIGLLLAVTVWAGVLAAAFWVVSLPKTRLWLADAIAQRLTRATGQPVRVGDVRLSLNPPRLVLQGVAVGPAAAPVLRVATAEVMVGDFELARREIVIDNLRLVGVWMDVGSLPKAPRASAPWVRVLVRQLEAQDVQVERFVIPGGVVLSAHDVEARWSGSRRSPISAAVVHVGSFTLVAPGVEPITGRVMAWGRETNTGWEVGRIRGNGEGWVVEGAGRESRGELQAHGSVEVDLAQLDRTLHIDAGLAGVARATGSAALQAGGFRVDAEVSAATVRVAGLEFHDLDGKALLSPEGLEATLSRATFAGGRLEGSYVLGGLGPPWVHRVALRGEGVELASFLRQLGADAAGLSASARVSADVAWNGADFKQGAGTGIADLEPGGGDVPASGRVVVGLAHDGTLSFNTEKLLVAGAPVHWAGGLTLGTWLPAWKVQGENVPIAAIARLLHGWTGSDVLPPALHGGAAFDIDIRGPFTNIEVGGAVAAAPIAFGAIEADGLRASFLAGHGVLSVPSGVVKVGSGHVDVKGELRYGAGGVLQFVLAGQGIPLARLVAWGGVRAPLAGDVALSATLAGTLASPQASAELQLTRVAVAGVSLGDGTGRVRLRDNLVTLSDLTVGPLSASAHLDLARREVGVDAKLLGFGLEAISPPLARVAGGALDCALHGNFPLDSPAGVLEITSAQGAHGRAELDAAGLHVELARPDVWRLSGEVRQAQGGYRGNLEFTVESWRSLAEELAGTALPVEGRMQAQAQLSFAPPHAPRLQGVIQLLDIAVEGEGAALEKPAHFDIEGGAIHLAGATLVGKRSNLFVRAGRERDGTLSGNVSGELPAALLGLVWPDGRPSGRIELLGEISGTDSAPRFEGVARVTDGSLRIPGFSDPVTHVSGVLEFSPEAIRVDGVDFYMLGGTGACNGRIVLSPRLEFDLAMSFKSLRWPLIPGLTPILTGDVRLVGPLTDLSLSGKAVLNRTAFRRDIDLQQLVVEQIRAPERARVSEAAPIALNIAVNIPGTLEIETTLAHVSLRGDLRIVGNTARYGVLGRLEALPGGELELSGVQYELDRASVTFTSPETIAPSLDVLARTTVQTYDITIALVGPLNHLTPTFTSSPALPEMDIVSLLFVGRTAEQASQSQTGAVASSFLTTALTGAVTKRARTLLDVDELQIDPFASTQSGSPTARLTVAKQLSHNWNVAISTNITSNREEIVTSRWRLGQGVYLQANREADGSYSMEVKWQRRY
jgi:hypothetical protein